MKFPIFNSLSVANFIPHSLRQIVIICGIQAAFDFEMVSDPNRERDSEKHCMTEKLFLKKLSHFSDIVILGAI